jgi:hypothetical protein
MRRKNKIKKWKLIEKFAVEQLEKYVKLHKKHEKEINYIG